MWVTTAPAGQESVVSTTFTVTSVELTSLFDEWAKSVGVEDWAKINKGKGFEAKFNPRIKILNVVLLLAQDRI